MTQEQVLDITAQGNGQVAAGQYQQALELFQKAIQLGPMQPEPYFELLNMLTLLQKFDVVLQVVKSIPCDLYQAVPQLRQFTANASLQLEDYDQAYQEYKALIDGGLKEPSLYMNIGTIFNRQKKYGQALEYYLKAKELGFVDPMIFNSLAGVYQNLGNAAEALSFYEQGLRMFPESDELANSYAMALMAKHRFSEAKPYFERRWGSRDFFRLEKVDLPYFKEGQIGQRVYVRGEQGIGDHIIYAKMLSRFASDQQFVYLETDVRLFDLFEPLLPSNVTLLELQDKVDTQAMSDSNAWLGLADLAVIYCDDIASGSDVWLKADAGLVSDFSQKYNESFSGKLKVGVSWKSVRQHYSEVKSTKLSDWQPILSVPNVQFFNLQYGDVSSEVAGVKGSLGVSVFEDSDVDPFNNISALAAQINALDLVITTSSVTAHLAGALGKEVWVLLPHDVDCIWYWRKELGTGWYSSSTIFQLSEDAADWPSLFDKASVFLAEFQMDPLK